MKTRTDGPQPPPFSRRFPSHFPPVFFFFFLSRRAQFGCGPRIRVPGADRRRGASDRRLRSGSVGRGSPRARNVRTGARGQRVLYGEVERQTGGARVRAGRGAGRPAQARLGRGGRWRAPALPHRRARGRARGAAAPRRRRRRRPHRRGEGRGDVCGWEKRGATAAAAAATGLLLAAGAVVDAAPAAAGAVSSGSRA